MSDTADDDLGRARCHGPRRNDPLSEPLDEQSTVWVEHDLHHARVGKRGVNLFSERHFEFAHEATLERRSAIARADPNRCRSHCTNPWKLGSHNRFEIPWKNGGNISARAVIVTLSNLTG
ncbi:hypothetical protein [Mesorhizobium sp. CAU 1732]|uniref:hypothetical protein n=1 Tax=Mesorhizobium sp. CAU 1732 TaxID=3140358 RepID=UPI00326127D8